MISGGARTKSFGRGILISLLSWLLLGTWASAQKNVIGTSEVVKHDSVLVITGNTPENKFGKKLQELITISPSNSTKSKSFDTGRDNFTRYEGLVITNIKIVSLDPFGVTLDSIETPELNKTGKILNNIHIETKERIVRKYLLFKVGDVISDFRLRESERILRQLSFIGDARVYVVIVSDSEAEVLITTQDVFSLGAGISLTNSNKGELSFYEKNISGSGQELLIGVPYNFSVDNKIGLRVEYRVNNIARTFADFKVFGVTKNLYKSYGIALGKTFVSAESKYAGALRLTETFMYNDLDTLSKPAPVEFTFQDYWIARSFMLNKADLTRLIVGLRYTNNNVYNRPQIDRNSYHALQQYELFLASLSLSRQNFVKTSMIYNFGRIEDIPYGFLAVITAGREINEFATRNYLGTSVSWGNSPSRLGYFNISVAADAFINSNNQTEQGILDFSLDYFTGLISANDWKFRGFVRTKYTTGFDRFTDEYLTLGRDELITGFKNDSIRGQSRIGVNLELDVFCPSDFLGFKIVLFSFADFAFLGSPVVTGIGSTPVTGIGAGIRIRNDNLIINTFQIRFGYYPNLPLYSNTNYVDITGVPVLKPRSFDAKPPSIIVYR